MRKLLTIISILAVAFSMAQKKPNVNKAQNALQDGDYAFAKSEIERATEYEKTKDDAKTWFVRGMIYMTLDTAEIESGVYETAMASFDKALELDPEQNEKGNYPGFTTNLQAASTGMGYIDYAKNNYYAYYYNKALEDYNAENYSMAADGFETAYAIYPSDTNAILNAAYAANLAGDDEAARRNFEKSLDAGIKDKNVFLQLYNYSVQEKDYEKALEIVRKAKKAYPDDPDFSKYEIGLLIELDMVDDAMKEAKASIDNNPNNPELYFSYATLLEETGNPEEAEKQYKKALEIDPDHYNCNFNLGVLVFNRSQGLIKERNALGYKEKDKINELTEKINAQLEAALPIWEKLYNLDATDSTVLETLNYIYTNLGINDKAKKMQDELETLGG